MLIIRKEQLNKLNPLRSPFFLEELANHVKKYFPRQTSDMPEKELINLVTSMADRALNYELSSKNSLCLFCNLSMMYGMDFDTKTNHAWMKDYLQDTDVTDKNQRMSRLYKEVIRREELAEKNKKIRQEFWNAKR